MTKDSDNYNNFCNLYNLRKNLVRLQLESVTHSSEINNKLGILL